MIFAMRSPAPHRVSSDLGKLEVKRQLSAGIDWAIAGAANVAADVAPAAPTAAVRRNLRRCMSSSLIVFLFAHGIPLSGINVPCGAAPGQTKSPAGAGLSSMA